MNEIVLTGCNESHFPISAMAAFGVLRVLTLMASEEGARKDDAGERPRLSWQAQPRWTAVLHSRMARAEVMQALADAAARATTAPVWTTHSDLRKFTPEAYRELLQTGDQMPVQELSTAFACEWPVARDGKLMLTPFFMTSGQQQWCKSIRAAAEVSQRPAGGAGAISAIEEALFGPWRYAHELSALGWDPATERQHALQAQAPTKSSPKSVAAAVWLAAESLALFPCFAVERSLRVPCFEDTGHTFFWPVWRSALTYDAVRALLRLPLAAARRELSARGIDAVFASRRMESAAGHGYYVFWPAELVWSS